jgi:hypothetical protein
VNYALMTWRTEARQPAGSEGSISPIFVWSLARRLGTRLTASSQPRRTKTDEPRMRNGRLGHPFAVCRLPPVHQVSFALSMNPSCLASDLPPSLGTSCLHFHHRLLGQPSHMSLNSVDERLAVKGRPVGCAWPPAEWLADCGMCGGRTRAAPSRICICSSCLVVVCRRHVADDWP